KNTSDATWSAMEEFFSTHKVGLVNLLEKHNRMGLVSNWKEFPDIPLILSLYLTQSKEINLYIEAFLEIPPPNYSTTVSIDSNGKLRFDSIDSILGEAPEYYHPILIPDEKTKFLAMLPQFQKEYKRLKLKYQRTK
ncbi:hypothetical protein HYU21_02830, partial [Candidatus Woesearchaeota archaeon]|nr:hypothetical protein [Candidatus Woesearchaeota archaeon]